MLEPVWLRLLVWLSFVASYCRGCVAWDVSVEGCVGCICDSIFFNTFIVSESTSGIEIKFHLFTDITQAAQ